MNNRPTYRNIHNRFLLNGRHYSFEDLTEIGYSFVKEGAPYEQSIGDFLLDWTHPGDTLYLKTSGSTGMPKKIRFNKQAMVNSALATGDFFGLSVGDKALHCLHADFIAGKMMLVRAMILGLEIDLVPPQGNVLAKIKKQYHFSAMVPLQVSHSLNDLDKIKTLLIGGASTPQNLKKQLVNVSTKCFETYGMTETLTHIAARPISINDEAFRVMEGVTISQDKRECLCIQAPNIVRKEIVTNDLVTIVSEKEFFLRGRVDHIINSGGVKVIPEEIETLLSDRIKQPFFIGCSYNDALGEKIILVVEGFFQLTLEELLNAKELPMYSAPKEIHTLPKFVYTENGKIKRKESLALLNL